jgi:hypothetical protein
MDILFVATSPVSANTETYFSLPSLLQVAECHSELPASQAESPVLLRTSNRCPTSVGVRIKSFFTTPPYEIITRELGKYCYLIGISGLCLSVSILASVYKHSWPKHPPINPLLLPHSFCLSLSPRLEQRQNSPTYKHTHTHTHTSTGLLASVW